MKVEYSTSWTWIGGNPKKRHNTVKVVTENGKTKEITTIKSFATEKEAKQYAERLAGK